MRCYFYLKADDAQPVRLGPYDALDDADARALAATELARRPDAQAIDIWCDSGELFRVDRPCELGSASKLSKTRTVAFVERRGHL